MKLYIISGLGASDTVFQYVKFPENLEVIHIPWLIPQQNETVESYVKRMAEPIDETEHFALLGYSFGGFIVQEINKIKPAQKVVILGSIYSNEEIPKTAKFAKYTRLPHLLPKSFFGKKTISAYGFLRTFVDTKNPNILKYFTVKDTYYLKWSLEKIADWKFETKIKPIQILGDKDIVFPIKNSTPDYVIKGGTHLFPATKHRELSKILQEIFED